jgi:hypothetical protein
MPIEYWVGRGIKKNALQCVEHHFNHPDMQSSHILNGFEQERQLGSEWHWGGLCPWAKGGTLYLGLRFFLGPLFSPVRPANP